MHLHVIPRYCCDMDDPRGGVRHVIPSSARRSTRLSRAAPASGSSRATTSTSPSPPRAKTCTLFPRATDGQLECRVVEVARLPGPIRTFHPKSGRFESAQLGVCFVGSSNISRAALGEGIEWNLRIDRDTDARAWARATEAFDELWSLARPLDEPWVAAYAARTLDAARRPRAWTA